LGNLFFGVAFGGKKKTPEFLLPFLFHVRALPRRWFGDWSLRHLRSERIGKAKKKLRDIF
jgi:hypothetical protein